jgi:hypothetical protein
MSLRSIGGGGSPSSDQTFGLTQCFGMWYHDGAVPVDCLDIVAVDRSLYQVSAATSSRRRNDGLLEILTRFSFGRAIANSAQTEPVIRTVEFKYQLAGSDRFPIQLHSDSHTYLRTAPLPWRYRKTGMIGRSRGRN